MIIKKTLSIFILGLLVTAVGCKSTNSDTGVSSGTISATIDGKSWEGQGGSGVKQSINMGTGKITTVTAVAAKVLDTSTGDSETMEVSIYGEVGAESIAKRTYNISTNSNNKQSAQFSFISMVKGEMVSYVATSGSVTVEGISDDNVKGTFEGTLTNARDANDIKEVTNGGFNVDFTFSYDF